MNTQSSYLTLPVVLISGLVRSSARDPICHNTKGPKFIISERSKAAQFICFLSHHHLCSSAYIVAHKMLESVPAVRQ